MGTFSLWQLVVMAIVTFGIVVPAVLAAWMIWRCPGRSEALARAQERGDEPAPVRIAMRDGV